MVEPSHVLLAMGMPRERALGAIRFSLGRESTLADVERAAAVVPAVVAKVRKLAGVLGRTDGRADGRSGGQPVENDAADRGRREEIARPPDRQTAR